MATALEAELAASLEDELRIEGKDDALSAEDKVDDELSIDEAVAEDALTMDKLDSALLKDAGADEEFGAGLSTVVSDAAVDEFASDEVSAVKEELASDEEFSSDGKLDASDAVLCCEDKFAAVLELNVITELVLLPTGVGLAAGSAMVPPPEPPHPTNINTAKE